MPRLIHAIGIALLTLCLLPLAAAVPSPGASVTPRLENVDTYVDVQVCVTVCQTVTVDIPYGSHCGPVPPPPQYDWESGFYFIGWCGGRHRYEGHYSVCGAIPRIGDTLCAMLPSV